MKNTRTSTLKKYLDDKSFRLSSDDRSFLADLAKVRIIDEKDAGQFHYTGRKTPASRRLDKLCDVGILESMTINQPGRGKFKAYTFKSDKVASLFHGKKPVIGRKRNALHEVITSRLYFAEGRPNTFVLESDFTKDQKALFEVAGGTMQGRNACYPDALFIEGGELVAVEADSGQYNKSQILNKQLSWQGIKQVWGQPAKSSARVTQAKVHQFS